MRGVAIPAGVGLGDIPSKVGHVLWKYLCRQVRVSIRPNRRPWKNGVPPKKAEIGWGAVKKRGFGVGVRTRTLDMVVFLGGGR